MCSGGFTCESLPEAPAHIRLVTAALKRFILLLTQWSNTLTFATKKGRFAKIQACIYSCKVGMTQDTTHSDGKAHGEHWSMAGKRHYCADVV